MASRAAHSPGSSSELRRALTQRQLTMMTIGGAIGVGLFLGSSVTIRLAGPGGRTLSACRDVLGQRGEPLAYHAVQDDLVGPGRQVPG